MKHSFSILHISDLHERGPRERERARRERVLGVEWLHNLDEMRSEGVDLLCMTGDLAQSGKFDEYDVAGSFLDRTLSRLGLTRERLFIVPGNHDIDRSRSNKAWQALRGNIHRADELDVSRWIAGGPVPLGMETAWRNGVLRRQEAFRAWLKSFGLAKLLPESSSHGNLGYRARLQLPDLPFDVCVVGLDSAWLAGSDDDAGKLRLTDGQIHKLCRDEGGQPLAGFRLVLIHHPLTEIFDGSKCRRLLGETTDLVLRGHLHEAEPELWADPDRRLRQFAAGCLFEGNRGDRHPNGCTLLRVTCDDAGRPQRYDLRFRSFSPHGGHWHDDNSLYRTAHNGRLSIVLPPASEAQTSNPQSPPAGTPRRKNDVQKQRADAATAQSQHVQSIHVSGSGNTVIIQQSAHGNIPTPRVPGVGDEAGLVQAAPPPQQLDTVQQYRQILRDTYARTFSGGLLGWKHSQHTPQSVSRLELFVPQRLRRIKKPQMPAVPGRADRQTQHVQRADGRDSEYQLPEQVIFQCSVCLLLGAPGAGKSELTRWLALQLGTVGHALQGIPSDIVPILIELRDLDDEVSRQGSSLGGIVGYITKRLSALGLAIAASIPWLAAQGRLLLLFDGMDEVRLPARRMCLAEMIRAVFKTTRCRVVVTSRLALEEELVHSLSPASPLLAEEPSDEFVAYYLEPFDDLQIAQFIDKWHHQTLGNDSAALTERRGRLRRSLEDSRPLHELATNPLLLTLLCALNYRGELPRRRHLVLAEAAELMIHRWEAKKLLSHSQAEVSVSYDDKRRFLEALAWGMQNGRFRDRGVNRIHRDDLFPFALAFWGHLPLGADELERRMDGLLRELEQHDHLLTHLGSDLFGFLHRSFLEFLAARYAAQNHVQIQLPALFRKHGFDEGWLEVFTLCCGLLDDEGKAAVIKVCLQDLLREVPLRFQNRDLRMAYAAVAIRCLAELRHPESEPYRLLSDLIRQIIQRDSLAIMRRGFGAWRDQEVISALRHFGPRWPSLDAWCEWALQTDWRENRDPCAWRKWVFQCVLAATPISRRVEVLSKLLQTEENLHVIAGSLEEASLLGPWQLEEVVRLGQSDNEELLIRIGLELAKSGKPDVLVALLQRPVDDWICLYIARDNFSSADKSLWEEAGQTLFRLTLAADSRIRDYAVSWLAPVRNDPVVCQRFLELARNDGAERVRFRAAHALLGTDHQEVGMAVLVELTETQDPDLLDWLATALRCQPDQCDRRRGILMRILDGGRRYSVSTAVAELALSFMAMPEVESRLVVYLESHPQEVNKGYGLPPIILQNQRVFDAFLRALFAAEYYDWFNHGLLGLTDILKNREAAAVVVEKLRVALLSTIPEKARLYIAMWFRHHGFAEDEASTHLRWLSDNAQDDAVRVQAAEQLDIQGVGQLFSLVVHTSDQNVRSRAIWALVRHVGNPKVREWLADLAQSSSDSKVRIRAALALYNISDNSALREAASAILVSLANENSVEEVVRVEAAEELVLRPALTYLAETANEGEIRLRAQDSVKVLSLRDELWSL